MLSALLLTLALPPWNLSVLGFLALAPLVHTIHRLPEGASGRRSAAWAGFTFAGAFWTLNLLWVLTEVAPRYAWAYPGFGALILMLGGLGALFGAGIHRMARDGRWPLVLAVPVAWVAMEWIKGHAPFGLAFPWLGLGVSLTAFPELLAPAELLGEAGVAFWLASVSGALIWALAGPSWSDKARRGLGVLALVAVPALASVVRDGTLPLHDGPRVLAVGTDLPPRGPLGLPTAEPFPLGGWDPSVVHDALAAADEADPGELDLLVLPEGVMATPPGQDGKGAEAWAAVRAWAGENDVPVLLGGPGTGPDGKQITNSAYLLSAHGQPDQRYDKVRLVPGMELGRYARGGPVRPMTTGTWAVGPALCYESLFGALARSHKRAGSDLLVNLSSDVWFGQEGSTMGSWFLSQHPAHLVLRAVETRTPVARAANGGFTGFIDPRGRWDPGRLPPGTGAIWATLPVYPGVSLFTRWGDLLGPFCLVLALGMVLRPLRGPSEPENSSQLAG